MIKGTIEESSECWKYFGMVKLFQYEWGRIIKLKDVKKVEKGRKRSNRENGVF